MYMWMLDFFQFLCCHGNPMCSGPSESVLLANVVYNVLELYGFFNEPDFRFHLPWTDSWLKIMLVFFQSSDWLVRAKLQETFQMQMKTQARI